MDKFQEQLIKPSSIEQAQNHLKHVFDGIGLSYYFAKEGNKGERIKVAILGAGAAVEVLPLTRHFVEKELGKPEITAFDVNPTLKKLSEVVAKDKDVDFRYEIRDLSNPEAFGEEKYDLVIARNPGTVNAGNWEKIFANGFSHLKSGGLFVVASTLRQFIRDQLEKGGKIIRSFKIPEVDNNVFFPERDVLIAQKT